VGFSRALVQQFLGCWWDGGCNSGMSVAPRSFTGALAGVLIRGAVCGVWPRRSHLKSGPEFCTLKDEGV